MANMGSEDEKPWQEIDWWEPYRGKYPDPTAHEYDFICNFLCTFAAEKDDFVEDEDYWAYQNEYGIPNLRQLFLEHLHQIRESKGYDVEHKFFSPFEPNVASSDEYRRVRVMEAAMVAISSINAQTTRKSYEFVSVDKSVWVAPNRSYLLTLTVKEVDAAGDDVVMVDGDAPEANADDGNAVLKTIRAMVFAPTKSYKLTEWRFKS